MEVHLDLAEASTAQLCQPGEMMRFVFLLREEERVPGRTAITVAEAPELARVLLHPVLDALLGHRGGWVSQLWLVMVCDAEQQMDGFVLPRRPPPPRLHEIRQQPAIEATAAELPHAEPQASTHRSHRKDERAHSFDLRTVDTSSLTHPAAGSLAIVYCTTAGAFALTATAAPPG